MMSIRSLLLVLVVGMAFVGVGGFMLLNHQLSVGGTEQVDGTVLDKGVARLPGGEQPTTYKPWVQYRYEVDNETYVSKNVYPGIGGQSESTRLDAEEFLEQYPRNETVTVYVKSDDPGESFLVRSGFPFGSLVFMGIGIGAIALGIRSWRQY